MKNSKNPRDFFSVAQEKRFCECVALRVNRGANLEEAKAFFLELITPYYGEDREKTNAENLAYELSYHGFTTPFRAQEIALLFCGKWEESIKLKEENDKIKKTIKEEKKEKAIDTLEEMPEKIKELVESGELIQWRKFPHYFFVAGVEKARLSIKKGVLLHSYYKQIPTAEQKEKFKNVYGSILDSMKV